MPAKIDVRNVRKSFVSDKGSLPVIDGISFTVADGEFVAIVGSTTRATRITPSPT